MSFLAELRRRWWLIVIALVLLVAFFATRAATFYTDVQWFDALGFSAVFWTLLGTRVGIGAAVAVGVFALLAVNLLIARRTAPAYRIPSQQEETIERYREALDPYARWLMLGVAGVVGLLSGLSMAGEWRSLLLFLNGGSFGVDDPHFGRDVGYFMFDLPFWELVNSWLFTTLAVTIVLTAIAHYLFGGIRPQSAGQKITPQVNVHLSLLLAALIAVRAWGFWLDRFLLSYSERGTVTGLSYTDVNAQLLAYEVLAVISVIIVVLFLANIWLRTWLVPAGGVGLLIIAAIVLAGVYPAIIQRLEVEPQELARERQYIARNLEYTRYGYGIRFESGLDAADGGDGQGGDGQATGGGSGGASGSDADAGSGDAGSGDAGSGEGQSGAAGESTSDAGSSGAAASVGARQVNTAGTASPSPEAGDGSTDGAEGANGAADGDDAGDGGAGRADEVGTEGPVGGRADIDVVDFPAEPTLSPEQVNAHSETLSALRMWDPAVLQQNFDQQQQLRQFYQFRNVDVDRYQVENSQGNTELLQVMLSARELSVRDLPEQTWENRHVAFTHGYGVVAADVNAATASGDPRLLAQDMPMTGLDELVIDNPRLYYGEQGQPYSIVGASRPEFDFPDAGGEERQHRYDGAGGVPVSSWGSRLAFGLRFGQVNFLISDLITDESRVLFERGVRDRIERVAPFLQLDHDPYPVVTNEGENGRVKWIVDAYTTSNMMPYSERQDLGQLTLAEQRELEAVQVGDQIQLRETVVQRPGIEGQANYLRNSVKAVVDAYDGSVELYVTDENDPIVDAWQRLFPDVFTDLDDAPQRLQRHFRYPEDGFRVQSATFEEYHVRDPGAFYQGEDEWVIPRDAAFDLNQNQEQTQQSRPLRPHYQLLRLPGEDSREFSLVQQFLPRERPNLAGMLIARNDGEDLGKMMAFSVPRGDQTLGPSQLLARLDREGSLANLIGVWNQSNAEVVYGNTIIVPVGPSLVYAQPLFLQPDASEALPQLSVVALSDAQELVWSTSLGGALQQLYGEAAADIQVSGLDPSVLREELDIPEQLRQESASDVANPDAQPGGTGAAPQLEGEVVDLINEAASLLNQADQALADGNLGEYQRLNGEAAQILQQVESRLAVDGGAVAGDGQPDQAGGSGDSGGS